ncbi:phosphodiester glycosidase family protein [Sulfitobacter aestuariivivens]|uniref:Phosphodiester glycosidase family protein n=1 Tax=Sulfitobacter aestuariivivens TaxID=2766981 RepID=A0A927HG94_9RHOB|nr:phosphodiester glycosidase family protein [Sulfitobacter aestuariivivens]MBD3665726.1 phosphodiester glycosidase family protein [Sulfitobacter aestuariivivens]
MKALLAGLMALLSTPLDAAQCAEDTVADNTYVICTVDLTRDRLELFLYDANGDPYGHFGTLDRALQANGKSLGFATNAGMYHEDRAPVGHYVEDGTELRGVISSDGPGNFGLLPNGVLCLRKGRADVFETERFLRENPTCIDATQSGPMLVIDGALHPRFLPNSTSRYIRNGVGTSADGKTAVFVISNNTVTFHEFGSLFRDYLKLPNALYFDGNVSRVRAPDLGRNDAGFSDLGPIIGVVQDVD